MIILILGVLSLSQIGLLSAQTEPGAAAAAPVVFFDIAGANPDLQARFYSEVFGWEIATDGSFSVPTVSPLQGTLRTDAAEKVIYIGVPDIEATLVRVVSNGGAVVAHRFEVPGVVVLGLFTDPAGNRMGLVEMEGGRARIP